MMIYYEAKKDTFKQLWYGRVDSYLSYVQYR